MPEPMAKGVKVGIDRDGPRLVIALRSGDGSAQATLSVTRRAGTPLVATLAAALAQDDDSEAEIYLETATLETTGR